MQNLKFAKLNAGAKTPTRKHLKDAGADVFALYETNVTPWSSKVIRTGITFEIPEGYMFQVWPKSKSDHLIGAGIIDEGYQGEILIKIANFGPEALHFEQGEAIAQLVLVPVLTPHIEECTLGDIHVKHSDRRATGGIVGQQ